MPAHEKPPALPGDHYYLESGMGEYDTNMPEIVFFCKKPAKNRKVKEM